MLTVRTGDRACQRVARKHTARACTCMLTHVHAPVHTCMQASSGSSYCSSSPSRATGGSNDSHKASVEASLEKLSAPALKTLISSQGGYYGAGIGPGALRELAVEVLGRGSWERAAELVAAAEAKVSNVVLAMQR